MVGRPTIAVIPARHHATRFPGKPLALIDGEPLALTALETTERLEQLRSLELGIPTYVTMCRATAPVIGVDVPSDVGRVEAVLRGGAARDRGTI